MPELEQVCEVRIEGTITEDMVCELMNGLAERFNAGRVIIYSKGESA